MEAATFQVFIIRSPVYVMQDEEGQRLQFRIPNYALSNNNWEVEEFYIMPNGNLRFKNDDGFSTQMVPLSKEEQHEMIQFILTGEMYRLEIPGPTTWL